jgi:hypothetical protein
MCKALGSIPSMANNKVKSLPPTTMNKLTRKTILKPRFSIVVLSKNWPY